MDFSNLSSTTIAIIVVLVVAGFFVGNFMGARPKAHEMRTSDLRLLARSLRLHPKLIAYPDWLPSLPPSTGGDYAKPSAGMIAQYGLILDEFSLPLGKFIVQNGRLQPVGELPKKAQILTDTPLDLPDEIAKSALGLYFKANSIVLFWDDRTYRQSLSAHKLDKAASQADLQALIWQLNAWANQVQNA